MSVASTAVSPGSRNPGVPRNDAVGLSGTSREEAERPSRPEPEGRFLSSSTEKPTRDVLRAYVLRMPGGWDPPEIGGQDSGSVSRGGAAAFGCDVGPAFPGQGIARHHVDGEWPDQERSGLGGASTVVLAPLLVVGRNIVGGQACCQYRHGMSASNTSEPAGSKWRRFLAWAAILPNPHSPSAPELETELTPIELANRVRQQFYKDRNYLRIKRSRWAFGAIFIRLIALGLSSTATILLGLSELKGPAAWGFALSAIVTTVTALEPFFNFRSRWVSADEALAGWHRAEEELTTYVQTTARGQITLAEVTKYDEMRREEWLRFSQDWLSERRKADFVPHS